MFRLAHLSDPHLGPVPRPTLGQLASKRLFGYANWKKLRARSLGGNMLDRITADMAAQRPDHVAVTGDLVNIALPTEFDAAARWLATLEPRDAVTVTLGNHDAYVPGAAKRAIAAFAAHIPHGQFPAVRTVGAVAIIAVSSAVATPPGYATGTVGLVQRERLATLLDKHDDKFRIVLIHHPPDEVLARGRRRLTDAAAVKQVLRNGCADLVLHGHNHANTLVTWRHARGATAVVGVGSASSDGTHYELGSYALIAIDPDERRITVARRGARTADAPIRQLESRTFDLAKGAD